MEDERSITDELLINRIYFIRSQKVMLDSDLAGLYGVKTKVLKQSVRRNIKRFPEDFMFELNEEEFEILRSHFVTSSWGGERYTPMAFSEQGVAMLSAVLRSDRAIEVNIQIMRVFIKIRQVLADHTELRLAIEEIKRKTENHSKSIELVFSYLDELLEKNNKNEPRRKIGYYLKTDPAG